MQFKTAVALSFASLAVAQDPSALAKFQSDVQAYIAGLISDPSFASAVEALATQSPAFFSSVQALATAPADPGALTAPPAFFTQLPSPYNSMFLSVYSHELAIASSDGVLTGSITSGPSPTAAAGSASTGGTAISTGGAPTSTGVMIMGAAAGVIGAVAALL